MTLTDFDEMFDTAKGAKAIVIGEELRRILYEDLLIGAARYVESPCPPKYPTYGDVDLIVDERNPYRFEPIF